MFILQGLGNFASSKNESKSHLKANSASVKNNEMAKSYYPPPTESKQVSPKGQQGGQHATSLSSLNSRSTSTVPSSTNLPPKSAVSVGTHSPGRLVHASGAAHDLSSYFPFRDSHHHPPPPFSVDSNDCPTPSTISSPILPLRAMAKGGVESGTSFYSSPLRIGEVEQLRRHLPPVAKTDSLTATNMLPSSRLNFTSTISPAGEDPDMAQIIPVTNMGTAAGDTLADYGTSTLHQVHHSTLEFDDIDSDDEEGDVLSAEDRTHPPQKISLAQFTLLKCIGRGSYGTVILVRRLVYERIYAMKVLRKEKVIQRNQVEHTKTERLVMERIRHPFIVELFWAFHTATKLYLVMEFCPGGELFFHLSRLGRFTEDRTRFYAAQIVLALEHLHSYGVIYRDLKPENILLDSDGYIRLTDFGLSKRGVTDNNSAQSLCGTPEYLAPEILQRTGHGKAVDWWNLGALIYEMTSGLPPFYTRDKEKLFLSIKHAELRYRSFISKNARSLMHGLLQRDPEKRLGGGARDAADIKEHPFFDGVDWDAMLQKRVSAPFVPSLNSTSDVSYFDRDFVRMKLDESLMADTADTKPDTDVFDGFTFNGFEGDPRRDQW